MAAPVNINNHLQIYTHATNGRAVRTRQAAERGTWLLQNAPPLFMVNTGVAWNNWAEDQGGAQTNWMSTERLQARTAAGGRLLTEVNMMADQQRQIFRRLYHSTAAAQARNVRDYDIFQKNSWAIARPDPANQNLETAFLAVYNSVSRINHSCRPNAIMSHDAQTGSVDIIAIRQLAQGEEVTLNYLVGDWLKTMAARRVVTRDTWGFQCTCVDCVDPTFREGNKIRQRIKVIQADWPNIQARWRNWTDVQRSTDLLSLTELASRVEILLGRSDEWIDAMLQLAEAQWIARNLEDSVHTTDEAWREYQIIYTPHGIRMPELDSLLRLRRRLLG